MVINKILDLKHRAYQEKVKNKKIFSHPQLCRELHASRTDEQAHKLARDRPAANL
jgi:hypothetical protein